jgi:hypothetical protein
MDRPGAPNIVAGPLLHGAVFLCVASVPLLLSLWEISQPIFRPIAGFLMLVGSPLTLLAFALADRLSISTDSVLFGTSVTAFAYFIYGAGVGRLVGSLQERHREF